MARSSRSNMIGNILQKVGRTLSSDSSSGGRTGRKNASGASRSADRNTKSKGGAKTLLRRLLQ